MRTLQVLRLAENEDELEGTMRSNGKQTAHGSRIDFEFCEAYRTADKLSEKVNRRIGVCTS